MSAAEDQVSEINYVVGDATQPEGDGYKVIAHCCNNRGGWGAGFVVALSNRWKRPENEYRAWHKRSGDTKFRKMLGAMLLVPVEDNIAVANIIGQEGTRRSKGIPPIRYNAISRGFEHLVSFALSRPDKNVSIHMPRIGCGLAGGQWDDIEMLILESFVANGVPVTVYDLP